MADLVDAGAAKLDESTGALLVQCKGAAVSPEGDAPDYGDAPWFACLGVTAVPYPADENGGAGIQIKNGVVSIWGTVVLGGRTPFAPVHAGVGVGSTSVPSPGVFVGV